MNKKIHLKRLLSFALFLTIPHTYVCGQDNDIDSSVDLDEIVIKAYSGNEKKDKVNQIEVIGSSQLVRAACCNLGESFTTNPSVDATYSDAATGAKQIKLLGLNGKYVQMLIENVPNLRGAAIPYGLSYIPGTWMQSIQVSKGASSVKNGYESTTGQINIEYKKPQTEEEINGNLFINSSMKYEANMDGNIHINDRLSTNLLLHYENRQMDHDGNHDNFMDIPHQRQYNLMHRWRYFSDKWVSQILIQLLHDERESGMIDSEKKKYDIPLYRIGIETKRYAFQWKNALFLNSDKNSSVALMLHGSWHDADNDFGNTYYDVTQKNGYAQLMYETDFSERHSISTGVSLNCDKYDEASSLFLSDKTIDKEIVSGIYTQYTYKLHSKLTAMAGIRWDFSSKYDGFFTPRVHLKYSPSEKVTFRASVGKGRRTPHCLAENSHLLASGRNFYFEKNMKQEEAWNYGFSTNFTFPVHGKNLEVNAEYYFTNFQNSLVVNVDGKNGDHSVSFENLDGKNYSHTIQVDATYPFGKILDVTAACRFNDVRTTFDGILCTQPLTSRIKGLLTMGFKSKLDIWHFDITGQINGKGKLYDQSSYPAFFQLQAQISREFRHFTVYVGGENLTAYKMSHPVIAADNPWSDQFDATQVWGPTHGAMAYAGLRFNFKRQSKN